MLRLADSFSGREDRVADNTDNRYRTLRRKWRRQTRVSHFWCNRPFCGANGTGRKPLVLREIGTQSSLRKHALDVSGELRTMASGHFHSNLGTRRPRLRRVCSSYVHPSAETSSMPVLHARSCRSASMWSYSTFSLFTCRLWYSDLSLFSLGSPDTQNESCEERPHLCI